MPKTNPADPDHYLARLQNAISKLNGCDSKYVETVTVSERFSNFRPSTIWQGQVAVFEVLGHPNATRAYAWSYEQGDEETRYVVVLEVPPVTSPQTAVQAAMAAQIANGTFR